MTFSQLLRWRKRLEHRIYYSRLSCVAWYVLTMNGIVLLYSFTIDSSELEGHKPLRWFITSLLVGIIAYEMYKAREAEKEKARTQS